MRFFFKKFNPFKRRASFALAEYRPYLQGKILDVGAGASSEIFKPIFKENYLALDMSDSRQRPDIKVDFESGRIDFPDNSFDTVLCFDNLEHLDACHKIYDELLRVSRKYVVISLPNNWPTLLKSFVVGRNISHRTGYGISAEDPKPGVRHKWFFNLEEAEDFLIGRAHLNGAQVVKSNYVYERGGYNLIKIPLVYPFLFNLNNEILRRFHRLDEEDRKKFGKSGIVAHRVISLVGLKAAQALLLIPKTIGISFYLIDELLKHAIWGWGSKYRYLNMFCRQIWVVLEKDPKLGG